MLDSTRMVIKLYGMYGFSAKYIQKKVPTYEGDSYSTSTIYKALREEGVSLREYRNGESSTAKEITKTLDQTIKASIKDAVKKTVKAPQLRLKQA